MALVGALRTFGAPAPLTLGVRPTEARDTQMNLEDAIFMAAQMSGSATVCAKEPFSRGAEAIITPLTEDYTVPKDILEKGYKYFLEASGIEELLEMIEPKVASSEAKAEFIIHYATFDAYPAWFNNLQDQR